MGLVPHLAFDGVFLRACGNDPNNARKEPPRRFPAKLRRPLSSATSNSRKASRTPPEPPLPATVPKTPPPRPPSPASSRELLDSDVSRGKFSPLLLLPETALRAPGSPRRRWAPPSPSPPSPSPRRPPPSLLPVLSEVISSSPSSGRTLLPRGRCCRCCCCEGGGGRWTAGIVVTR